MDRVPRLLKEGWKEIAESEMQSVKSKYAEARQGKFKPIPVSIVANANNNGNNNDDYDWSVDGN